VRDTLSQDRLLDAHAIVWKPHIAALKLSHVVVTHPDDILAVMRETRLVNTMGIGEGVSALTGKADNLLATLSQSPVAQTQAEPHRRNKRISIQLARAALEGLNTERIQTLVRARLQKHLEEDRLEVAHDVLLPVLAEVLFDALELEVTNPASLLGIAADYMMGCHPISSTRNLEFLARANDTLYERLIGPVQDCWCGQEQATPIGKAVASLKAEAENPPDMLTRAVIVLLLGADQLLVMFVHALFSALTAQDPSREDWFKEGYVPENIERIVTQCSGVRYLFRRATQAVNIADVELEAGQFVCINLPGQPDDQVDYRPAAFGAGRHKCPGEKLSLALLEALLPVVLAAFKPYRVGEAHWTFSVSTRCITRLVLQRREATLTA
jgi:cytochrome P450